MATKKIAFYNISAPCVIAPPSPLNALTALAGYTVQVAGSAGVLTFNDCATLGAASAANQVLSLPYNVAATDVWPAPLNLPLTSGLVISAVPTGMVLSVTAEIVVAG